MRATAQLNATHAVEEYYTDFQLVGLELVTTDVHCLGKVSVVDDGGGGVGNDNADIARCGSTNPLKLK